MGNCGGAPETGELKMKRYNPEKYNTQIEDIADPEARKSVEFALNEKPVGGLKGYEKLEFILRLQAKFRRMRNFRRAKAIASANRIREVTDRIAAGEIESHANQDVQEKLQTLGRYKWDNRNIKDLGVEREYKPMQKLENEDGTYKYYEGQWSIRGGKPDGYGIMIMENGGIYEGCFSEGKMQGKGRFIHHDCDVYEGDWRDNKAEGYGTYTHADGALYEGEWLNDKQHGHGKEVWVDGAVFEGQYADGKKNGEGVFDWADGGKYVGSFKDNKMSGRGIYTWKDGKRFDGEWADNKMHGTGVFTWDDGRKYEGEYVNDKKEGQGVFTWADGKQYDGQWKNGKQHGEGTFIVPKDGESKSRTGIWEDGKRKEWTS